MDEAAKVEMRWTVCPAGMYPKKAAFGWLIILVVGLLISSTSIMLGICLTALLIGTQATFLFPTTFTIGEEGLNAKYPIRKKYYTWEKVRRAKFLKDVCYLFTRKKPSNLDGWSGIAVFYGDKRDEIITAIKSHLREDVTT